MKFVALAAMLAAAQAADTDYKIDLDVLQGGLQTSKSFTFPNDSTVTITAIENRSWGYAWDIKNECGARFKLVDDSYGYDDEKLGGDELVMGRRGRRTLTFQTAGANSNSLQGVPCFMTFTNKRPWLQEPDSPDQVRKISVVVGEKLDE